MSEDMAAVLAEHVARWRGAWLGCGSGCNWRSDDAAQLDDDQWDAHRAHVAAELARSGFGAVDETADALRLCREAFDRVLEQRNEAEGRATRAEAALASAKAEALREAADEMVGTHGTSPHARFLRDRADQIARTDESELSNNAGHDATEVGICLCANQICEQPNHHGCKTCLAVEPTRPACPHRGGRGREGRGMSGRCPGPQDVATFDKEAAVRVTCEGTARQYHLSPAHPHLFCGCGNEAEACHPGRCCADDDWGQCVNCGKPPMEPEPTPEIELSDTLWADQ